MIRALQEIDAKISSSENTSEKFSYQLSQCELLLKLNPTDALDKSNPVLKFAIDENDSPLAARAFLLQGHCYIVLSDFEKARDSFKNSLLYFRKDNNINGCANAVNQLGTAFVYLQNYDKALECYYEAMQKSRKIGDKMLYASCLTNMGSVYRRKCNFEQAIRFHYQSLETRKEIGDESGITDSLMNIGAMYCSLDAYDLALEYFFQALERVENTGQDIRRRSMVLNNIGNVYFALEEYSKSLEFHTRALLIKQSLKDLSGESISLNNCAGCHHKLGDNKSAISFMLQSLAIKEKIGDKAGSAMIWGNLAEIYFLSGEYLLAEDALVQAENRKAGVEDIQIQLQILLVTALISIFRQNAEEAQTSLQSALQLGQQSQQKEFLARTHKLLSELYSQIPECHDRKRAMEHFAKYTELRDEIVGEKQKRAVKLLELRYHPKNFSESKSDCDIILK